MRNPDFSFRVYVPRLVNNFLSGISGRRVETDTRIIYHLEGERVEFVTAENRFDVYGRD